MSYFLLGDQVSIKRIPIFIQIINVINWMRKMCVCIRWHINDTVKFCSVHTRNLCHLQQRPKEWNHNRQQWCGCRDCYRNHLRKHWESSGPTQYIQHRVKSSSSVRLCLSASSTRLSCKQRINVVCQSLTIPTFKRNSMRREVTWVFAYSIRNVKNMVRLSLTIPMFQRIRREKRQLNIFM